MPSWIKFNRTLPPNPCFSAVLPAASIPSCKRKRHKHLKRRPSVIHAHTQTASLPQAQLHLQILSLVLCYTPSRRKEQSVQTVISKARVLRASSWKTKRAFWEQGVVNPVLHLRGRVCRSLITRKPGDVPDITCPTIRSSALTMTALLI